MNRLMRPITPPLRCGLMLSAIALLGGCSYNPATGGADITVMSRGKEVSIGNEMYETLKEAGGVYPDEALQAYVNEVGQRLVSQSDTPKQSFTFTVIDSPDINAFATPGGFVYINRGLLAYLDNEDELAGVLGHEIAHVTARHAARQQTGRIASSAATITTYILTGSAGLANASSMYGRELVSGYGREHELEADGLGAKYMYRAGYDADELLEVITILKDQEQYQRALAKDAGGKVGTYHGLYATHPRNDQRLQTVIRAARDLGNENQAEDPVVPGEFKRRTDGLLWGAALPADDDSARYYHQRLGFSFAHPPGWTVTAGGSAIVASAPAGNASVTLSLARLEPAKTPEQTLRDQAQGTLSAGRELQQEGLVGYTAIAEKNGAQRRLAVIEYKGINYLFEGKADAFADSDPTLLTLIESFRPLLDSERGSRESMRVRYIQVPQGTTFASLANGLPLPDAENQLRLINGFYPRGEPRTGDWIKVLEPVSR